MPLEEFVVQNEYVDDIVCFYKSYEKTGAVGDETTVLAENMVNQTGARRALAHLKLKMRKEKYQK